MAVCRLSSRLSSGVIKRALNNPLKRRPFSTVSCSTLISNFAKVNTKEKVLDYTPGEYSGVVWNPNHFTTTYHGYLATQQNGLLKNDIGQLKKNETIDILRGDPHPIFKLLAEGVLGKNPHDGHKNILSHRVTNANSQCVSFSFSFDVAAQFGAASSIKQPYKLMPEGSFNVILARIAGSKYDAASPGSDLTYGGESEVTVVGKVAPESILGWRACRFYQEKNTILCGDLIHVDNRLSENEINACIKLLSSR